MTKKEQRKLVYDKFNGRCYLCGTELNGKFHVDEVLPIRRNYKYADAYWEHKITKEKVIPQNRKSEMELSDYKYVDRKLVRDGEMHPERFHIDNQMPSCASCNINKHSMSLEEFRKLVQGFMKHLNELNTQYKIAKRYGLVKETIKPIVFYFEQLQNKLKTSQ